jgi:hypothetical protein
MLTGTTTTPSKAPVKLVQLNGKIIPNPTHIWVATGPDQDSEWWPLDRALAFVEEKSGQTFIWTENLLVPENKQQDFAKQGSIYDFVYIVHILSVQRDFPGSRQIKSIIDDQGKIS